ncbi:MAG: DNA primase [Clostridia bacterium]|nr:DNA primase [Clostridia bacterium]
MAIPEEIINEIKYKNDIEQVISPYVTLKRRGKNLVGLCPFHGEKTPSFTVYPDSSSFYCFGCGVGGDIFTFTKLIENLDYIEAVKLLAEKSGITLPEKGYDDSYTNIKNTVFEINRETAKFYHNYLMSSEGKWALDYLLGRGLNISTIKHFGLGAAPDSWDSLINHLKQKGFSVADMVTANVVGKSQRGTYYDRFRKRVIFPIINIRGKVIAFSGRAMPGEDKQGGKYVNTADTPVYKKSENLFGMNFAKNYCDERIILVEGNMDVVSLHQAGFQNAVAALGTAFTPEQAAIISRYTKEIILTLDADAAGQKAVKRAGEILKNTGLEVRVIVIPDGKDPDEFIKKHGKERFIGLLEGSVSEIEYKLLTAAKEINTYSDDGRVQYLNKAAEIIAETNDVITTDLYIGKLCEKYGVSRAALQTKVNELKKRNERINKKKVISDIIHPKFNNNDINPERRKYPTAVIAEEAIISVLLSHPDFYSEVEEKLKPEQFITTFNRRIYTIVLECIKNGNTPDISYFGEILNTEELSFLVSLFNSEKYKKNSLTVLKDSINVILDETVKINLMNTKDMSDSDWAANMQKMIENKKRGNT